MLKPDQVVDYLRENPTFLVEHQELLAEIDVPAEQFPFHQRQVEVLRQRHSNEQARYQKVVDSARNNSELEHTLHQLSLKLLACGAKSDDQAIAIVVDHFSLDHASIVRNATADSDDIRLVLKRVTHGSSVCDDRVSSSLLEQLFGTSQAAASCAFVPLSFANGKFGALVLGSSDASRFQPGMGPIYLDRLGELIAAFLQED